MDKEIKIKVSIILPTYNGGKYIKTAIESVIFQSFFNWELIIINDGSSDNTESIVKEYTINNPRIIYLKNEQNIGVQKTLNRGLKEAKGEYIARIDDDDEWINPDKLSRQIEFLINNLDCVLVGTGVINTDGNGQELFRYLLPETDKSIRNNILYKNCFVHSSVVFKKEAVLNLEGYDESTDALHIEDYDLWLKLGTIGKLANLSIYAVKFTLREGSMSSLNKLYQLDKDIILIKKYKDKYPNYTKALILSYLRLFLYKIFDFIFPPSINSKIFKLYKQL